MHNAKQAMQQVAARLTNQQLSAAFYAWHQAAQQRRHAVQSAHKILLRFQQGCKVMNPFASGGIMHCMNNGYSLCISPTIQLHLRYASNAGQLYAWKLPVASLTHFLAWPANLLTMPCMHIIATERSSAMLFPQTSCLNIQAAAFDGWVEAVHSLRHNRQVLAKALKRIVSLKLSQAFDWWRHQAEALRIARAKAGQIIVRMQHQSLAIAFSWWVEAVAERQQVASQQEQLVDAAVTRSRSHLQRQIFQVSSNISGCVHT